MNYHLPPPPPTAALIAMECGVLGAKPQDLGGCTLTTPGGGAVRMRESSISPSRLRAEPECYPHCASPRAPHTSPLGPGEYPGINWGPGGYPWP